MLIVGAKGFAKEVLEIIHRNKETKQLVFFDDVNLDVYGKLYEQYPIFKHSSEAKEYFEKVDQKYTIGIGGPLLRKKMFDKFNNLGGVLTSTISDKAIIGSYNVNFGVGANILDGVLISNDVTIGLASIIYYNSVITHDCILGDFVEISPSVSILGRVEIGQFSHIGSGAIILPGVKIGSNVIVGAGSVVTKDVGNNCVVVGTPAKIIKQIL